MNSKFKVNYKIAPEYKNTYASDSFSYNKKFFWFSTPVLGTAYFICGIFEMLTEGMNIGTWLVFALAALNIGFWILYHISGVLENYKIFIVVQRIYLYSIFIVLGATAGLDETKIAVFMAYFILLGAWLYFFEGVISVALCFCSFYICDLISGFDANIVFYTGMSNIIILVAAYFICSNRAYSFMKNVIVWKQQVELESINVSLSRSNSELEKISKIDALTGLYNRYWLDVQLSEQWRICANDCIAAIMFDIDFFKKYNDTYGHQSGDICLRQCAQIINAELKRKTDKAFRYGGEEFVVLLPFTNIQGAEKVALRILEKICAAAIPHVNGIGGIVTMSAGACSMNTQNAVPDNLIKRIDVALYDAKNSGRNNCKISKEM
ncbi:MAG: GGDEF domain-containing protein [Clostridiales bacterium]|jgi:diguanylate cyclase (GGDEF)-like protein|nr:GGDEF domain-containing protein [Clostridiales bacterium]